MILQSICKINLGLNIVRRRSDGYHDIETLMYPIQGLYDLIEIKQASEFSFSSTGIGIDCPEDKNLCVRAFRLMQSRFGIGNGKIHLHKMIPTGAGLGGGSADATTVIKLCNEIWKLALTDPELISLAAEIGSDTSFFVTSEPQFARGRGEILTPHQLSLKGLWIMMVKPNLGVSTAEAYAGVMPMPASVSVMRSLELPIEQWKDRLKNDFELSVFSKLPELAKIKSKLYENGATYASMSGSGSTVFGLFENKPQIPHELTDNFVHIEQL